MAKLTENTLIPFSLVITFLGFVFWLATLAARTDAIGETVTDITNHNHERDRLLDDALIRIERIDIRMQYIYETTKEQQQTRHR